MVSALAFGIGIHNSIRRCVCICLRVRGQTLVVISSMRGVFAPRVLAEPMFDVFHPLPDIALAIRVR